MKAGRRSGRRPLEQDVAPGGRMEMGQSRTADPRPRRPPEERDRVRRLRWSARACGGFLRGGDALGHRSIRADDDDGQGAPAGGRTPCRRPRGAQIGLAARGPGAHRGHIEHLEEPVRAARALSRAGRQVALKIPLERRIIRTGLRRQRAGPSIISPGTCTSGHWLNRGRCSRGPVYEILEEFCAEPPESIRYHKANAVPRTSAGGIVGRLRRMHHRMETQLSGGPVEAIRPFMDGCSGSTSLCRRPPATTRVGSPRESPGD